MYFRKNSFIINIWDVLNVSIRSSRLEVFLRKGVQKICSKCTGKHQCRSAILIKLESSIIETTLRHGCSPVNLLHILWIPFVKINSGRLLLVNVVCRLTLNTTKSIDKKSIIVFVDLYFQSLCDVYTLSRKFPGKYCFGKWMSIFRNIILCSVPKHSILTFCFFKQAFCFCS